MRASAWTLFALCAVFLAGCCCDPCCGRPTDSSPEAAPAEPALPGLRQRLEATPVTVQIDLQPFADAVATVATEAHVTVSIDPELAKSLDGMEVTLHLVGVNAATALNLLAKQAGDDVEWSVEGDGVRIHRR
jgi:hypothetical protein